MTEKRKYQRYSCKIKADFEYFEGKPEEINIDITVPTKGKGFLIDISSGGAFLVSDDRVPAGVPIRIYFSTKKKKHNPVGRIVRTGMLKNNPSEVALRFNRFSAKGEIYIAVEFENQIADISEKEL